MVIEDKLRENAALYPDKVALVCGEKSLTYRQLYQAIKDKADSMGDIRGCLIPIVAYSTVDFFITYFALHLTGAVAVPLHKDIPAKKLNDYAETLEQGIVPEEVADILFTTGTTGNAKLL